MAAAAMLELSHVSKFYGTAVAVDDVDLTVTQGEFLTLLGPSGSGKSTILGMIAGYVSPDRGSIRLRGQDVQRMPAAERGIGVVFQNYALFPHMTVAENIAYGLKRRHWPRPRVGARVEEMIGLVGLEGLERRRPAQLSGGQQQRVALARALAFEPALLLMDEPLGALDQEIRLQMQDEVRRIHRELRPTVVYVTHNKTEAFALSDRIAIMRKGRAVALGPPGELYHSPASEFVATFFGGHHVLDVALVSVDEAGQVARVRVAEHEAEVRLGSFVPNGRPLGLAVAPEYVGIDQGGEEGIQLDAVVEDVITVGSQTHVNCSLELGGQRIVAERRSDRSCTWKAGDRVRLTIDPDGARLVPRDRTTLEEEHDPE
jgi:putative spermidine/putrescine transport system ATP-binding protein